MIGPPDLPYRVIQLVHDPDLQSLGNLQGSSGIFRKIRLQFSVLQAIKIALKKLRS
jgi:hypothetical protein